MSFLGLEWVETHVMAKAAPSDFFRNDLSSRDRQDLQSIRVIRLAEMLHNLQYTSGFAKVLQVLKSDSVEASYAELEVAKLLAWKGQPFRFVTPRGVRGEDYDLEILVNGQIVCADTKCKLETTPRTDQTLYETLREGRKSVPPDKPGILFVKLPQTWIDTFDDSAQILERVCKRYFSNTGRIVSVKFYFQLTMSESDGVGSIYMSKEYDNPRARHASAANWTMLQDMQPSPDWLDLVTVCE